MNAEQDLADIESAYETSKHERSRLKTAFEIAKAKYHGELVARRENGETLTVGDMRALEMVALDDNESIRSAYLSFMKSDTIYRQAKVRWEAAKRDYWDRKDDQKRELHL